MHLLARGWLFRKEPTFAMGSEGQVGHAMCNWACCAARPRPLLGLLEDALRALKRRGAGSSSDRFTLPEFQHRASESEKPDSHLPGVHS